LGLLGVVLVDVGVAVVARASARARSVARREEASREGDQRGGEGGSKDHARVPATRVPLDFARRTFQGELARTQAPSRVVSVWTQSPEVRLRFAGLRVSSYRCGIA